MFNVCYFYASRSDVLFLRRLLLVLYTSFKQLNIPYLDNGKYFSQRCPLVLSHKLKLGELLAF